MHHSDTAICNSVEIGALFHLGSCDLDVKLGQACNAHGTGPDLISMHDRIRPGLSEDLKMHAQR